MSESRFVIEPYTNDFGQVINPGDEVIYIGTSWGGTSVDKGVYEGVYLQRSYTTGEDEIRFVRVGGIPGRRYSWNPETNSGKYVDVVRKAYLQLGRVYRLDTPLNTFAGRGF